MIKPLNTVLHPLQTVSSYIETNPVKTKHPTEKRLRNEWLDNGLLKAINQNHKLYKNMLKYAKSADLGNVFSKYKLESEKFI